MFFSTFISFALFVVVVAAYNSTLDYRRQRRFGRALNAERRSTTAYTLKDFYHGEDFLNQWDFFSASDPTHGMVDYQTKAQATAAGLAVVQSDGTTVLSVDDTTTLKGGASRKSVRISSQKSYTGGLFIADFFAMPHGCAVWPAWWSVGPQWPAGGEIDIIEGVNDQTTNQFTLHTSSGCKSTTSAKVASSKILGTQCATVDGDNTGCAFLSSDKSTYGHSFNELAGGVYAHLWNDNGIKVWHFTRGSIPADITSKTPDPSTWGTPQAFWESTDCNISQHFKDHVLTIDTTLCGDWAGAAYGSSSCPGTCAERVADPANFKFAKWMINYIAVYDN